MRKGTYIGYHIMMVCLSQKRKRRQQKRSIDNLLAQAQAGDASMDHEASIKTSTVKKTRYTDAISPLPILW